MDFPNSSLPHGEQPVVVAGNTESPSQALVLIHGRDGSAQNFISFTEQLEVPENTIIVAPQAENFTWYPQRFIVPKNANQPGLDSALQRLETILETLAQNGIPSEQVVLGGFSQGACLVAEYVKQHPAKYRGVAIMSGGLIGDEHEAAEHVPGELAETPVYLGCDEADFHIPAERVYATAGYFTEHHGDVSVQLYQGLGHVIHPDAVSFLHSVLFN